jgi:hypothetical protein
MQRLLRFITYSILIWISLFGSAIISQAATGTHTQSNSPICLPDDEFEYLGECSLAGPTRYREPNQLRGFNYPPQQLIAQKLDPSYASVPYYYARVTGGNAPIFGSLEAAVKGSPILRRLEPGFVYITYIDAAEVNGKRFYMIEPGIWMRGGDISRVAVPTTFQGLLFKQTPIRQFGWLRNQAESKRTPGYYPKDTTGNIYNRYDRVQIYDIKTADEMDWYLIAPDEWIEGRQVSRVIPSLTPPEGVDSDRWIEVNLAEQTIAVYEQGKLVFATMIASGREGSWTQPGLFQIYEKKETENMRGAFTADRSDFYSLKNVPWTMYFDQARALHGTYWHNRFGYPQSRGCINLSTADANWLFQWAKKGDWVHIWDPSGETPTDPALYGAGGA